MESVPWWLIVLGLGLTLVGLTAATSSAWQTAAVAVIVALATGLAWMRSSGHVFMFNETEGESAQPEQPEQPMQPEQPAQPGVSVSSSSLMTETDPRKIALALARMQEDEASTILSQLAVQNPDMAQQVMNLVGDLSKLQEYRERVLEQQNQPQALDVKFNPLPYYVRADNDGVSLQKLNQGLYSNLRNNLEEEEASFQKATYEMPNTWGVERQFQDVLPTDPESVAAARSMFINSFEWNTQYQKDPYNSFFQPFSARQEEVYTTYVPQRNLGTTPSYNQHAGQNATTLDTMYRLKN